MRKLILVVLAAALVLGATYYFTDGALLQGSLRDAGPGNEYSEIERILGADSPLKLQSLTIEPRSNRNLLTVYGALEDMEQETLILRLDKEVFAEQVIGPLKQYHGGSWLVENLPAGRHEIEVCVGLTGTCLRRLVTVVR